MHAGLDKQLSRFLEHCQQHPRRVLSLLALISLIALAGLLRLRIDTGLSDWLPASDPDVQAFRRIISDIDGVTNQELLWLQLEPNKARAQGVDSIRSETAIRAQDELARFVIARVPEIRYTFGLPHWLSLANYSSNANDPAALRLPENSAQFRLLWQALQTTQGELLSSTISSDDQATLLGFIIEGDPLRGEARALGRAIADAVTAYRQWPDKRYDLFDHSLLTPIGLASGLARIDSALANDLRRYIPAALLLLVLLLALAFRRWQSVALTLLCLLLGLLWTAGFMGFAGMRFNIVNIAIIPLLLGSGIDYAIHMQHAYQHTAPTQRLQLANSRVSRTASALVVASLISLSGLLALCFADIPGMVDLALTAMVAIVALHSVVMCLPAALYRYIPYSPDPVRRAPWLAALQSLQQRPWLSTSLLIALCLAAWIVSPAQSYQRDVIQGNFPSHDPVSRAVAAAEVGVGGAFPEFLILTGDLSQPSALAYQQQLQQALRRELGDNSNIIDLASILGSYALLRDGVATASLRYLRAGGNLAQAAPQDQASIRQALESMQNQAAWAPLRNMLVSPDADVGVMIILPPSDYASQHQDPEAALYYSLQAVRSSSEAARPEGLQLQALGYRSMGYVFMRSSQRWLQRLLIASLLSALLWMAWFSRSWSAVLALLAVMVVSSQLWFALLPLAGVSLSIFSLFPLIFMLTIASDYAVHLIWAQQNPNGDNYALHAVSFSALTDAAIFLGFSAMYLVSAHEVMRAVVLAVCVSFASSLLISSWVKAK